MQRDENNNNKPRRVIYTVLSSRTVDGHQIFSGGSVIGETSTIDSDISPPSSNFHRGSKM